ncbi:L,D-transpeptidase [Conexibacter stalactiti]|uniref:L,D-transpeptidase n=1 Tax=Conexibacter stalactiti TaxID=1940611 RepID=A0ABU4HXW4_9ACTN|nr:L,D-transpeptidase [Conexibacter stalactiti]MDW5598148.1 L,D-transpeptidase [Conexibacter stalactiti]MEC5038790.1 L,D-transpeptidase [Conexibacter stalactiti]
MNAAATAVRRPLARLLLMLACVGAAALTAASPAAATSVAGTREERLSNETTSSYWAYPARVATIRKAPSRDAGVVSRTQLQTEIGRPNVYLVLSVIALPGGGERWLKIRVPGRPNGRVGWVLRGALGPLHNVDTQIVVDRSALTATLRRGGRVVMRVPVGVGAAATPTPPGRFWVREKLRFRLQPLYGSFALGTSAYAPTLTEWPAGGVVGLHGTDEPWLIPGRPSHGCVRVRNEENAQLWARTPVGTPVLIR